MHRWRLVSKPDRHRARGRGDRARGQKHARGIRKNGIPGTVCFLKFEGTAVLPLDIVVSDNDTLGARERIDRWDLRSPEPVFQQLTVV